MLKGCRRHGSELCPSMPSILNIMDIGILGEHVYIQTLFRSVFFFRIDESIYIEYYGVSDKNFLN